MTDQPPPDDAPPAMTAEQRALRDAYLAELWPTCPEVPREQREIDRYIAAEQARGRKGKVA